MPNNISCQKDAVDEENISVGLITYEQQLDCIKQDDKPVECVTDAPQQCENDASAQDTSLLAKDDPVEPRKDANFEEAVTQDNVSESHLYTGESKMELHL